MIDQIPERFLVAIKEPSANMRRIRFGIRNARKKASVVPLAPKSRASTTSRINPRIRETIVAPPTVAVDLSSFKPVISK
jgi:hypothetical protein